MNCEEFERAIASGVEPSDDVLGHVQQCGTCQLDGDQGRLLQLLGHLPRIEPPANFGSMVRARIAEAKSGEDRESNTLFPFLRYAMPFGLALAVLTIVALTGLYFVESRRERLTQAPPPATLPLSTPSPGVASTVEETPDAAELTPESPQRQNEAEQEQQSARKEESLPARRREGPVKPETPEMSPSPRVLAVEGEPKVLTPKGVGPARTPMRQQPANPAQPIKIAEILRVSGIKSVNEEGRLKVTGVTRNSLAERSGIREGDFVVGINGVEVKGDVIESKSLTVSKLTLLRGKNRIEVELKP